MSDNLIKINTGLNAMLKSGIDPSVFVRNEERALMKEGILLK